MQRSRCFAHTFGCFLPFRLPPQVTTIRFAPTVRLTCALCAASATNEPAGALVRVRRAFYASSISVDDAVGLAAADAAAARALAGTQSYKLNGDRVFMLRPRAQRPGSAFRVVNPPHRHRCATCGGGTAATFCSVACAVTGAAPGSPCAVAGTTESCALVVPAALCTDDGAASRAPAPCATPSPKPPRRAVFDLDSRAPSPGLGARPHWRKRGPVCRSAVQ